ncbi:MAG: ergothioneine biosynthesis protein EgtB [Pyrinomonadaceae bacterium]
MQGISKGKTTLTDLRGFYNEVRSYTEKLCEPLETEDYIPQPTVDVSPPKWNIAHTTWFFEEMILKKHLPGYTVFDEQFGFLFNSYYNSIGKRTQRDHRGSLSRPTVKEVFAYRKYVDENMEQLLSPAYAGGSDLRDLVILGLNHEQQHQELFLTDLKYTLSVNPLFPVYRKDYLPEESVESTAGSFIKIEGGIHEIGYSGDGFCFDNELARHKVYVDHFEICSLLVTNGEFLEFIQAGGYADHRFWHSEGWDWVNQNGIESPLYWHDDGSWSHFTFAGLRELPPNAPVCHVSYYEAAAFAEWKGMRLPTEPEWETASKKLDWGKRWEWTNSAYLPYPGFKKAAGAVGEYNGKFMINQMVLRGASTVTPVGHSRTTYRNFFHPHLRWQFTGIRLVKQE